MDFNLLGREFATAYYNTFRENRSQIVGFYMSDAMMTYEQHRVQGHASIQELVTEKLRFEKIQYIPSTIDSQPTPDGGVLVLVNGRLKTDEDHPHSFSQTFLIKPFNNSFFISHDIFRLSIHDTM